MIAYRRKGERLWTAWPPEAHVFHGRLMTADEMRRVVEHHNAVYPDYEFRVRPIRKTDSKGKA